MRFIVWPAYLASPLLWAASDGCTWIGGQFPGSGREAVPGEALGSFSFPRWHGALMASMLWARYAHDRDPPRKWRGALDDEIQRVIDAGRVVGYSPPA